MISFTKNIALTFLICFSLSNVFGQRIPDSNYLIGKANLEAGKLDTALVYFDLAIADQPRNADLFLNKGIALYKMAQYGMAIKEFEKSELIVPGKASIWIARCYASLNDTKNCLNALEIHLSSSYRLPESTVKLDKDLSKLDENPEYISFWKNGSWYTALDNILAEASYLIKSEQYTEALDIIEEGFKKGYKKSALYAKRAEVYIKVENYKLALEDLNKSLEMDKRNAELYLQRADILYLTGKYKPALDDYLSAYKLNPEDIGILVGLSMSQNKNGFYDEAVKGMNDYLKYYPSCDTAWYQLGMIQFENANYFEALNSFNTSLKISQKDYRYFAARGATYLKTRTYQYAWKDLSMALDLNPRDSEVYVNKGLAAINTGKNDDACFCFQTAKNLGNKDAFTYSDKYCK